MTSVWQQADEMKRGVRRQSSNKMTAHVTNLIAAASNYHNRHGDQDRGANSTRAEAAVAPLNPVIWAAYL